MLVNLIFQQRPWWTHIARIGKNGARALKGPYYLRSQVDCQFVRRHIPLDHKNLSLALWVPEVPPSETRENMLLNPWEVFLQVVDFIFSEMNVSTSKYSHYRIITGGSHLLLQVALFLISGFFIIYYLKFGDLSHIAEMGKTSHLRKPGDIQPFELSQVNVKQQLS